MSTSSRTSSGWTSGTGLAIAKTIVSAAIARTAGPTPRRPGQAEEHVGAGQRLVGRALQAASVGVLGERCPLGIEVLGAGVEGAAAVADDDVADAPGEHDLRARHAGRACADDHDGDVLGALADDPQGVEQRGEHNDRRAVLVVMKDRDVELRAQPPFDLKQRGAEMSSRLMPPKVGATAVTKATISSTSLVSMHNGKASTPANSLNSIALPSITGIAAAGPMSPRPSTAVPSETTATVLLLMVSAQP